MHVRSLWQSCVKLFGEQAENAATNESLESELVLISELKRNLAEAGAQLAEARCQASVSAAAAEEASAAAAAERKARRAAEADAHELRLARRADDDAHAACALLFRAIHAINPCVEPLFAFVRMCSAGNRPRSSNQNLDLIIAVIT